MAPTCSQLRAAARKGKGVLTQNVGESTAEFAGTTTPQSKSLGPAATKFALKQTSKKITPLKKTPSKKPPPQLKELDVSVTILVGSTDISTDLLGKMDEFIQKECISGLCSIERGGAISWLHLQMVYRLLASLAAMVSKRIKTYLGWDDRHKNLEETNRNYNNVIFINNTQDATPAHPDLSESSAHVGDQTTSPPIYIPVFLGDHDLDNSFLL